MTIHTDELDRELDPHALEEDQLDLEEFLTCAGIAFGLLEDNPFVPS